MKKRICGVMLFLALCLFPALGGALAAEPAGPDLPLPKPDPSGALTLDGGVYVLQESMTVPGEILLEGDTELVLPDGLTLTVTGGIRAGSPGGLLIVSKRSGATGTLTGGEDNTLTVTDCRLRVEGGVVKGHSSQGNGLELVNYSVLCVKGGKVFGESTDPAANNYGISCERMSVLVEGGYVRGTSVRSCGITGGYDGMTVSGGVVDAWDSAGVTADTMTIEGGVILGDVCVNGWGLPDIMFSTEGSTAWVVSRNPLEYEGKPVDLTGHSGFFVVGSCLEIRGEQQLPRSLPEQLPELGEPLRAELYGTLEIPAGRTLDNRNSFLIRHGGKIINHGTVDNTAGTLGQEGPLVTLDPARGGKWLDLSYPKDQEPRDIRSTRLAEQKRFSAGEELFTADAYLLRPQIPEIRCFNHGPIRFAGGRWGLDENTPTEKMITEYPIREATTFYFIPDPDFAAIRWKGQELTVTTASALESAGTLIVAGYAGGRQVACVTAPVGAYEAVTFTNPDFQAADTVRAFLLREDGSPVCAAVNGTRLK